MKNHLGGRRSVVFEVQTSVTQRGTRLDLPLQVLKGFHGDVIAQECYPYESLWPTAVSVVFHLEYVRAYIYIYIYITYTSFRALKEYKL